MITKDNFLLHIKKIEEELSLIKNDLGHKQSNIFKTIINLSPNAIVVIYKEVYVYANPTALFYFGVKKEEDILNKYMLETIQPEFHDTIINRLKATSKGKKNEPITIKLKRQDNEELYAETVSIPIKFKGEIAALVVGRDVTNEQITKRQLEENEKLLEETERLSKIGRYKINLYKGEATWSKGLYDIFNLSYDALLPNVDTYYKYVHPQDINKVKTMLANCILNDAPFDLKYRIILPGNIIKHVHSKGEVKILGDGDKYLIGFYQDITEEVAKEHKIKEGEHHLRLLFDAIQEGIALNEAIYDEDGNIEDYKILLANKAFDRNSEYNASEVIGRKASEAYKMDKKYIKDWWKNNKKKEFPVYTELHRPDVGRWAYVSTSKVVNNKFVTAFFDITDKKKKDLLLAESENKYKSLVENSPTGVIQITKEKFLFANRNFLKLLGYSSLDELAKKSLFDFVNNNDKKKFENILGSTSLKNDKQNQFIRIRLTHKNGFEKEVEMLISEINSDFDRCWQCIISDISEKIDSINKAKKLSTDAIYMSRKLHLFSEIESQLNEIIQKNKFEKAKFSALFEIIKQEYNLEQLWSVFQNNFELVYEDFFKKLLQLAPSLTQQELKHCAFIKMNFETKEIATMFHIKPSSIQTSRVRLKKKLGLNPEQDLINFILTI